MKISYNFETTPEENIEEIKTTANTVNMVVDKLLSFASSLLSFVAQDKAASRASFKDDQISQLSRTVEILSSKLDRMENRLNSSSHYYNQNKKSTNC